MITAMPRVAIAVEDFERAVATFRDVFHMPVLDLTPGSVENLGAKLAMCVPDGGCNIEIMSPGNPETPLSQSLEGFLRRRGEGHFAMMFEADDPNGEADLLTERGLAVLPLMEGAAGRDIHPKSTHGVLIRVYPTDSFTEKDESFAQPDGIPALSGISRAIIAVRDMAEARTTYGERFGLALGETETDEDLGIARTLATPPKGGCFELWSPSGEETPVAEKLAAHLAARGEGLFALVLETPDLEGTRRALKQGHLTLAAIPGSKSLHALDPASHFGATFWIEEKTA